MIVGTAGHIDHGKSSLVKALTGVDTGRLKEEKARGISIDLGFAYCERPSGIMGFVDVPGHEGLVHTMIAGAAGIDFVLLVIAADDGVMPQTREHLAIIDLLGLTRGAVALTKIDLAGPERLSSVRAEVESVLAGTGLKDAPIIPVSAVTIEGLDRLRSVLDRALECPASHPDDYKFRLAVDRCFVLDGLGTTVTGTVLSGSVSVGDQVVVSPSGLEARVRSIHAHNRGAGRGRAGERCALVLSGPRVSKEAVHRGDMIVDPVLHAPAARIDARLRVLKTEPKPVGQWFPVKLHHAAAEVPGRVVLLRDSPIEPGEAAFVQLVLERPVAAAAMDRFVLRDTSSSRTIGGGVFIDLRAPARLRRRPERLSRIEALSRPSPADALRQALQAGPGWIEFDAFIRDRAIGDAMALQLRTGLHLLYLPSGRIAFSESAWSRLRTAILDQLTAFHDAKPDLPGIGLETMRKSAAPGLPARIFIEAARSLQASGDVTLDRMWMRLPSHEVRLSQADEQRLQSILPMLDAEPYRPPRVRDIAKAAGADENGVRRLLRMAARRGQVDEVAHDHFFSSAAVQAMAGVAIDLAASSPSGSFTAGDFRDRLDNGRKVAIQVLEYFDRHGLTMRRQDLRRIHDARVALFVRDRLSRAQ